MLHDEVPRRAVPADQRASGARLVPSRTLTSADPCTCGHKEMSHRYLPLIGDNSGDCLAQKCSCKIFEKAEK